MKMKRLILRKVRKRKTAASSRRSALAGSIAACVASVLSLSTAFKTEAATLVFDSDANGANGITESGGTFTWVPGSTLTFINPAFPTALGFTGAADIAQFGNGGLLSSVATINVGTGTIAGLIFSANSTNGYTLTASAAQTLTIGTSGIVLNNGAQATTLGSAGLLSLVASGNQTWTSFSNNAFTVAGNLSIGAGNTLTLVSGAAAAGGINITGNIAATTGAITVNSAGGGVVTLSGNNAQTGITTLTAGILRATTSANALGLSTVNNAVSLGGGTLQLANASGSGLAFNRNVTTTASSTILSDVTSAGAGNTYTMGNLFMGNQTLTVGAGAFVTSGTAGLTFGNVTASASTPTFNVNGSIYAGNVTTLLTLGTVSGAFNTVYGGTANTLNGALSAGSIQATAITTGVGTVTKNGPGSLTLTGASTYTGTTTINGGSFIVGTGAAPTGTLGATALVFGVTQTPTAGGGGGLFQLNSANAGAFTQTLPSLTFTAGDGNVQLVKTAGATSSTLTFSTLVARAVGATGNFISGGSLDTTNQIKFTAGATANTFINKGIFFGGSNFAWYDAGSYVRGINYGVDAGAVTSGAATSVASTAHLQTTGVISAQATGTSFTTLNISGNNNFTLAASAVVSVDSILKSGNSGSATIATGTIQTATAAGEMIVRTDGINDALVISSVIANNGGGAFIKSGAGTLTLSGANTFQGDVYLNGGTTIVGLVQSGTATHFGRVADPAAGTSKQIFFTNGAVLRQTVTFNDDSGTSAKTQFVFNFGAGGGVLDLPTGVTLTLDDNIAAGNAFNAAQLQGAGDLTKIGVGTLSLGNGTSNFGTFSGQIFINAGTLTTGSASTNPFGTTTAGTFIASGAVLNVNGVSIGAEPLTISGTGLAGAPVGVLISSTGAGGAATGPITLAGNSSIGGVGTLNLSGSISDGGYAFGITKVGTGTTVFSATNTYTGGTTISAGTLQIGNNAAAGSILGNITNNSALVFNRSDSITFGGSISGTGTLTHASTLGTLTLSNASTYTGATIASAGGTLSVVPGALAGTSAVFVGAPAVPGGPSFTSTLDFFADNVGAAANFAPGATMTLGGPGSSARIGLQLNAPGTNDAIILTQFLGSGGTLTVGAGGAILNMAPLPGFGTGTYTLIDAAGGITNFGAITLNNGSLPTGYTYTFTPSASTVTLGVTAAAGANFFWKPVTAGNSWNGNVGASYNWTTDGAGATNALSTPGAAQTVNFSDTTATGTFITTLDQNFSIAGINFLNSGTGAVTVNQGTFGTLTLGTGGITVISGAASPTINAPLAIGTFQPAWNVNDPGQTLNLMGSAPARGIISGTAGLTFAGPGTVTLGGFNTFSGGVVTSGTGVLNINNGGSTTTNSALGTGTVTLAAGTTLDNTSGVSQALLTTGAQTWNGNVTFVGASSLSLGTGTVNLGTAVRTVTVNGSTLAIGGLVSGAGGGIIKAGPGALTLSGANTFTTGGVTLNNGTLNVNATAALGTGTFVINNTGAGVTIDNTSGASVAPVNVQTWSSNFTYGGSSPIAFATGAVGAGAVNRIITVNGPGLGINNNALTESGAITSTGGLTKAGQGALILNNANAGFTAGNMTLNAGTLSLTTVNALGAVGNTLIINGGAIDGTVVHTTANPQTWNSSFGFIGTGSMTMGAGAITAAAGTTTVTTLANTLTLGGVINNTNTPSITKNGAGTIVLTGASTYTGTTTVKAGLLQLNASNAGAAAGSLAATSTLSFGGTGSFVYTNTTQSSVATRSQVFDSAAFTAGDGSLVINRSVGTASYNLFLTLTNGITSRAEGATALLGINGTATGYANGTSLSMVVGSQVANTIFAPGIFASTTQTATLPGVYGLAWYDTAGFVRSVAFGSDPFTATTAGGATLGTTDLEVQTTAAITAQTTGQYRSLTINSASGANFTMSDNAQVLSLGDASSGTGVLLRNGGGATIIGATGATAGSIGAGGITATGSGNELIIRSDAAADSIALNIPILSSTGAVTKSGLGTLILGGSAGTAVAGAVSNAFTGTLYLNAGTLQVNSSGATGGNGATGALNSSPIVINNGTLALRFDGDGTAGAAAINLASNVILNGATTISVDRLSAGNPISAAPIRFTTPLNKTLQLGSLGFGAAGITLTATPANGYGLEFTGTTTLDKSFTTINVGAAQQLSNVVQGLTLSGQVTGTNAGGAWTKTGLGTLALSSGANDFIGNIVVSQGTLAFNSDAALGNPANTITLVGATANTGIRAYGGTAGSPLSIATSRVINLWGNTAAGANDLIEVAQNTTLTLNAAFGANNGNFAKNDNGTLVLAANNDVWSGTATINAGVLRISNSGALGLGSAGTTVANVVGAALQLNGVSIWEQLNLSSTGINTGGSLQAVGAGLTSTVNALITLANAPTIGAETSTTVLNIRGGITGGQALTFAGAGAINIDTNGFSGTQPTSITKLNSGTTTITTANPSYSGIITVNAGTLVLGGGPGGAGSIGGVNSVTVNPGAAFTLDDSVGLATVNRMTQFGAARALTLTGGTFNYIGNASGPSYETLGGLTLLRGEASINITPAASQSANLGFTTLTRTSAATGTFNGPGLGTAPGAGVGTITFATIPTFVGAGGVTGAINKALLPYILVRDTTANTVGFATTDTTGTFYIRQLSASEQWSSLVAGANVNLAAAGTVNASLSVNSLNLASTIGVAVGNMQTFTVASGGVLTKGTSTISGGIFTAGAVDLSAHTLGDVTISSVITGSGGMSKSGAGVLTLGAQAYYTGTTNINQGTLKLGVDGAMMPGSATPINGGAILDLNGKYQTTGVFFGESQAQGTGGNVVGTAATSTLVINQDTTARAFEGVMSGGMSFARSGGNNAVVALTMTGNNTYTGATLINGNEVTLTDAGRLSGTGTTGSGTPGTATGIEINYAGLNINDSGTIAHADRVNDAATITMRGGSIAYTGRANNASTETLGAVNLAQGSNRINIAVGSGTVRSADLTLGTLTQTNGATLLLEGSTLTGTATALGLIGSTNRVFFANGVALAAANNGIIPFASINAAELVGYNAAYGAAALSTPGYQGYDVNLAAAATLGAGSLTQNMRLTSTTASANYLIPTVGGTYNANGIAWATGAATQGLNFTTGTDRLNLTSGALVVSGNFASNIGSAVGNGILTSGGTLAGASDLYLSKNGGNTLTVNSSIQDSGVVGASTRLVVTLFNASTVALTGSNTYSGGTIVNGSGVFSGTLTLSNASANGSTIFSIPGDLTVNGASVTLTTGGQIRNTGVLTINSGGRDGTTALATVTLAGNNTLAGVNFNNLGGSSASTPTLALGAGIFTLNGNITATSSNVASTSTISGAGSIALNGANRTVTVDPITFNGQTVSPDQPSLIVSSIITDATFGLIKQGTGLLQLSGASTFTGGVDLQTGGLIIAAASAGTPPTITAGPLGTGTLTIAGGTTITADNTARTVGNAVTVNGDFILGVRGTIAPTSNGAVVPAALTLSGAVNLGANRTITVNSGPTIVNTISGALTATVSLTKQGIGILALTGNNSATLNLAGASAVRILNGTLQINADAALGAAPGAVVANNIVIDGGVFSATATGSLNVNRGITLGGTATAGVIDVTAGTFTVPGVITGGVGFVKTGAGTLFLTGANTFAGPVSIVAGVVQIGTTAAINNQDVNINGGTIAYLFDGDGGAVYTNGNGTSGPQVVDFAGDINVGASGGINVGKLGTTYGTTTFTSELNKTANLTGNLTMGAGQTLTITPSNGYGVSVATDLALAVALPGNTFNVSTATASNVVQGLTLNGKITGGGTGAGNVVLTKAGAGTLVLGNTVSGAGANSFGGGGSIIDITGGVLSVGSNAALGDASNAVRLNVSASTAVGLRSTGTFTTARTVILNAALNAIEVTTGNVLTLSTPFTLGAVGNALAKNDAGVLELTASNPTWTGAITINQGALRVSGSNANILGNGTGTITISAGANATSVDYNHALQLSGGATVSNPLTVTNFAGSTSTGINGAGALQSLSGTNFYTGPITMTVAGASIGATTGVLNIDNTIGGAFGLTFTGGGTINLNSAFAASLPTSITKHGAGTVSELAVNSSYVGTLIVNAGTFAVGGAGSAAGSRIGGTGAITVQPGGIITVDDSVGAAQTSRLGGNRAIALNGGTFNLVGNAAGSIETLGALTFNAGGSTINVPTSGTGSSTLTFGNVTQNVGSTVNYTGTLGTANNKIVTGTYTLVPATTGILPRATVTSGANFDFATTVGGNGVTAFVGYNVGNIIDTAPVTDTLRFSANPTFVTGSPTAGLTAVGKTVNAVAINANGITVTGLTSGVSAPVSTLTLTSGGVLVNGTGAQWNVPITALGAEGIFHVNAGMDLTVNGAITGTAGLTKADGGTLNLAAPQYYTGITYVNGGTLKLASGATNTLFFNNGLVMNNGGSLDLNGGNQYVGSLSSQGAAQGAGVAGGDIGSSTGTGTLLVNSGTATYGGIVSGASVNFVRSGSGTLNILAPQMYGGATLINGGSNSTGTSNGTILADNGALTNTSSITINYSALSIDNARLYDNADRVRDAAPITMNGGSLNFYGRNEALSTETVGVVTLNQGTSVISSAEHINGVTTSVTSAELILSGFGRTSGSAATVDFGVNFNGNSSTNTLGLIGNSRRIVVTGGVTNTNNIIGGYAVGTNVFSTTAAEFVNYIPGLGVAQLNAAGSAGYDGTALVANQPTQNIRIVGTALTVPAGGSTVNSLNVANSTTTAVQLDFGAAGDILNLTSGGLLVQNVVASAATTTIGAVNPGKITAGGSTPGLATDLYLYYFANGGAALTLNSQITDNTAGTGTNLSATTSAVRLVAWGGAWGASNIILTSGLNDYTGGTVINQETLTIGATALLPGNGLTINGGTLTQTNGGTLTSQAVTLNGGSVLNLNKTAGGSQSLTGLTFNNNGGTATPTVNIATGTILSLAGGGTLVTVNSANVGTTATIAAAGTGILDFAAGTPTIAVNPIMVTGTATAAGTYTNATPTSIAPWQASLNITAPIANSGLITIDGGATGSNAGGVVQFSSVATTSNFAGGVSLTGNAGLIIGGSSTPTSGTVTSGPIGTGTLAIGAGSSLLSSGAFTLANVVTVGGSFAFNGTNAVTLSGPVTLPASSVTLSTASPSVAHVLSGIIGGGNSAGNDTLVKAGLGTLQVNNTGNNYTGNTRVNAGTLQLGAADVLPNTTRVLVDVGGVFNLNNFAETIGSLADGAGGGGLVWNSGATARILTLGGDDTSTTYSGVMANGTAASFGFTKLGTGTFTISGANTYSGITTVTRGTLQLGANEVIAHGAVGGNVVINPAASTTATFDLNGRNETINGLTATTNTAGSTTTIDNSSASAASLTFGSNNQAVTFGAAAGAYNISNSGGGALSVIKTGTNTATLTSVVNLTHTGATTVNGGTMSIAGTVNGTNALNVLNTASTLNLTGVFTSPASVLGVQVDGGATLSLVNGAGSAITSLTSLNLGAGAGTANLNLELGNASNYDRFTTSAAATAANIVKFNITGITGFGANTYTLLSAASGLTSGGASYQFAGLPGGFSYTSNITDSLVQLTSAVAGTNFYWTNSQTDNKWNTFSGTLESNWSSNLAGTTNAAGLPGAASTAIFSASNITGTTVTTTLESAFAINDLVFNNSVGAGPVGTINIGPGAAGTLTLAPSSALVGITLDTGAPAAVNISAPVVLGAAQTWTVTDPSTVLAVSGGITGTALNTLTKDGSGILELRGTNTYSGSTTISNGILRAGVANGLNANSSFIVGATGTLRLNGFSAAIGSLGGSVGGIVENNTGTAATLTAGANNASTTFAGTIRDGSTGALSLTKVGTGTLELSGANTFTGNALVNAGVLNITGTGSLTGLGASTKLNINPTATNNGVVNYASSGTTTLNAVTGATVANTASAYYQTAGNVNITPGTGTGTQSVVGGTSAYGYYSITGGTFRDSTGVAGGARFTVTNGGSASATNGTGTGVQTGVIFVGGTGFIDHTNAEWWLSYSLGQVTVADSGKIDHTGSNNPFAIFMDTAVTGGSYGVLNVAGANAQVLTGAQPVRFGNSTTNGAGNSGFVNLAAGTLSTGVIANSSLPAAPAATNYGYFNYAGGTYRATATLATGFVPATSASITYIQTIYGAINNSAVAGAPSFDGGLTIDSNSFNVTIPSTTPLLGATGFGVTQGNLSVTGGSGYIGAPAVYFSKPASASGVPASGYAIISGGSVVGIVITDPGVYAVNETPTVTLIGGFSAGSGGTAATVTSNALNAGNGSTNVSGGLTKTGLGTLTLSAANTYTGGTTVNQGSLNLGASNTLASTGNVTASGTGTLDMVTFNNTAATVNLQGSGVIQGTTGVLTSTAGFALQSGTVNFTGSGGFGGAVAVTKTTGGTVTLTNNGFGSFNNVVNANGGILAFSTSAQLGAAGAANTIGINGGTLRYTGLGAVALGATRVVTLGAGGGTLDASQSTGALTITGGIAAGSTGNLTKTGTGTVIIPGTSSWNSGLSSVTVSDGTLQAGFGTGGIAALTVDSGAYMNFTNGLAQALTLGNTAGALTLNGGSRLAFELGAPTTGDRIIVGATGTAVTTAGVMTLDFINLGGLAAGTYDLLQDTFGSGLLGGGVSYALGTAPAGFNYTINTAPNLISLSVVPFVPIYWRGGQDASWDTLGAATANWTTNLAGTTDATAKPQTTDTVIFSASSAPFTSTTVITTTLDANFTIDGLQFKSASPTGITAVTINQGLAGSTLTLAPSSTSGGILVEANAGNETINAPVVASTTQTWSIDGTGANGSSLTIGGANASVAFNAAVTKTGGGALTLSSANTGSGAFTLMGGTLNINNNTALGTGTFNIGAGTTIDNTSAGLVTLTNNNAQNWNGSFTYTGGTQSINLGTGNVTLGANISLTVSGNTVTVGGDFDDGASTFGLSKLGAGTLTLNGNNTYKGATTLTLGTMNMNGNDTLTGAVTVNAGTMTMSGTKSLGALTTLNAGVLNLNGVNTGSAGFTANAGTLNINNNGALGTGTLTLAAGVIIDNTTATPVVNANTNAQTWNGNFTFTGTRDLDLGAGAVTMNANVTITSSTAGRNLTVGGVIKESGGNTFNLTKNGLGNLTLTGLSATAANNYLGATVIDQGTLTLTSGSTAALAGNLTFGAASASANFGTLDLTGANASFGGLTVQNNNVTANTIALGLNTLTINGSVTLGNGGGTGQKSHLTVTGSTGSFVANLGTSGAFRTAVYTGGTNISGKSDVNLSGLGTFTVTGGASSAFTFVTTGDNAGAGNAAGLSTMRLASVANSIQAGTVTIGGSATGLNQIFLLGNATGTTNVFSADTFNIGTVSRDGGTFQFDVGTGAANGTVSISNRLGTGAAAFNMGTGTASTGYVNINTFDVTGHTATLNFGVSAIGTQNGRTAVGTAPYSLTNTFSFDKGTLTMLNLTASSKSSGAGSTLTTINIGSASSIVGTDTATITNGILQLGQTTGTGAAQTVDGILNIAGGTVNIGNTAGNSITMGSAVANSTANGTVNITGGVTTLTGNIIRGGGSGTTSATVTLDGATAVLDMGTKNIGGANVITLNARQGTLQNLFELNNGGALTKTTAGTLTLAGVNSYTGATNINAGTVNISTLAPGATAQSLGRNIGAAAVTLGVAGTSSGTLNYTGAAGTLDKNIQALGNGSDTIQNSGSGLLTLSGTLTKNGTTLSLNGGANGIAVTGQIIGAAANSDLTITGGTTTVSNNNTYNGATVVTSTGTLEVATGGSLSGTTGVTVNSGGTLLMNNNANNVINATTPAPLAVDGGTVALGSTVSGKNQTFASLTLSGASTLDFGTGAAGNALTFTNSGAFTGTLNVFNWSGTLYDPSATDNGFIGDTQDRFLFTNDSGYSAMQLGNISFFSDAGTTFLGTGAQITFGGGGFEIVPVPEPATTALIGAVALCALIGYRERRRFTGIRGRLARK